MRALAWDDNPSTMEALATNLKAYGVDLEIVDDVNEFIQRLTAPDAKWDFIVTDLVDDRDGSQNLGDAAFSDNPPMGVQIATRFSSNVRLVFILTARVDALNLSKFQLPTNVVVRTKQTPASWLALDVVEAIKEKGIHRNRNEVFVIFGHGIQNNERVINYIRGSNLIPIAVNDITAIPGQGIHQAIREGMSRCGTIIGICTPDFQIKRSREKTVNSPSRNVLYELGIAAGLVDGFSRLIIIQDEETELPSDFGGDITLRFQGFVNDDTFRKLDAILKRRGILPNDRPN